MLRIVLLSGIFSVAIPQQFFGQLKKMAAIGSSTTAGFVTSSPDSCWMGRFNSYYKCQLEVMDSCFNYGSAGLDIYAGMPTGFLTPRGRPIPDTTKNITCAVASLSALENPENGVIIVNYPSNGYNLYTIAEIMDCLQLIYDSATANGNRCFITTTQPRTDSFFRRPALKRKLADIKDSILIRFGVAHTINFWDGMFNPADSSILAEYSAGDGIHFNNAGHRVLFERILAKNVFNLPVWYAAPTGYLNLLTSWGSDKDGGGKHPVSFATDGQVFMVENNPNPTINADWTLSRKNIQFILGDGINPVVFEIPAEFKVTFSGSAKKSACY